MGNLSATEIFLILIVLAILAWLYSRICAKAGYPGALGFLFLVPLANLFMLGVLAFGEWPIHRRMRDSGIEPPAV